MTESKRCPFCGKEQSENNFFSCDGYPQACGCWEETQTGEEAEQVWNTRPIEDALNARIAELEAELKITDELLKEATETIGAVVACCTYNSNDDAKIGIYGIDQKAFTRIDQFITHYNDAVSAGKVSVDVKTSTDNNKGE